MQIMETFKRKPLLGLASAALVIAILAYTSACTLTGTSLSASGLESNQDPDFWPTQEWRTSTPEEQSMDSAKLHSMMELIDQQGYAYDSVLVIRHGHIVFEEYRNGYDLDTPHHLQSATKSFSSMLIGIAIHEGFLEGVDQKMVDLFPDHTLDNLDARKQNITLEHLLTMSDGMDWHEVDYPYTDARNTLGRMWVSRDAVQHVLDRPMARQPGESWAYNSGTSILLGGILETATGQDVLSFAREHLFDPIGIGKVRWDKTTGNHYHTDGGLYLTPRDMARFGYLMLHGGTWDGKEIVSSEWMNQSIKAHYKSWDGKGYGYQWWVMDGGVFSAQGHYEQKIYVVPETDMVIVFTGNIPDSILPPTDGLVYRYILAACKDLPQELLQQTFNGYGFTLEYPTGFNTLEIPMPDQEQVDSRSGMLQFRLASYPFELIQVMWAESAPEAITASHIEGQFSALSQQGIEYTLGRSWKGSNDKHEVTYQLFDFTPDGIQMIGLTGAWYCDETGRVIFFNYVTNPEVSEEELIARFQKHLDRFTCHET